MHQCASRSVTLGLAILAAAGLANAQPDKSREADRRSLLADMRGWTQAAEIDILPMIMEEPTGCAKQRVHMERWAAGLAPNGEPMGSTPPPRFGDRGPGPVDPTDVLNNTLEIEVAPPGGSLSGSNTMTIRSNVDNLTSFGFKLRWNFTVTACTVTDSIGSYTVTPTVPFSGSVPPSYARNFNLLRPINQNEVFTVRVDYTGTLVEGIGLGSVMFGGQNNNNANPGVVCTLSEPYYAATWWPCKDGDVFQPGDNADKATLNISITAPANFTSVANGVLQGIDDLPGNKRRYRWATTYPMSTYLVCFATTEYNHFTDVYDYGEGTMPLEFYIYPISDTPSNRASWLLVKDMLEVFRPKFGLYPFINEKYGIYQFEFSGGMEHQTFSGQGRNGAFLDWLSAHELAHQWWGDEVTCRTWSDIWLNEGFATYAEALWAELKPGSPGQPALQAWMNSRRPANPNGSVYIPPAETNSPSRIFNAGITYNKAAWVLHQLRRILGDETFFGFVQAYRANFAGGAPTTAEFIALCNSHAGQDLSWYFNPWVYDVGAPTYEYGFQPVTIGGQQYLRLMIRQVQDPAYPRFTMPIDVDVTVDSTTTTHVVRSFGDVSHFLIPIPAGSLDAVALDPRNWVLEYGKAQVAYTPGPPKVVMTTPAPGLETFAALAPSTVTVQFSDSVSGVAADFAVTVDGDPVSFSFSYSAETNTATLDFGSPLPPGAYALFVSDALTSAAPTPLALDGEIAVSTSIGSLPSGDGAPGGIAMIAFSIVPDSGSCCSPSGACSIGEAAQCGHLFSLGGVCDPNTCPQPGACCAPDGSCSLSMVSAPGDCASGSFYLGDGSSCTPNPCPQPEACCAADGACSLALPAMCAGSPQGPASACEPNPCPEPTGACCCGSNCSITTADGCLGPGMAFAGPSTACSPYSTTIPCCRGDYNRSGGSLTVQDIFDFLSAYFASDACADTNDSAQITVQDIFDFLSAYFGGCP
ncbi:MAG: M1 family aminopeptidase [Phycisphaerales bacterium]